MFCGAFTTRMKPKETTNCSSMVMPTILMPGVATACSTAMTIGIMAEASAVALAKPRWIRVRNRVNTAIKSGEIMRDACQADVPATIVGRSEAMEKRIDTMLQAIRAVRPALEAFYATLSDEQKARLDSVGHGRSWR